VADAAFAPKPYAGLVFSAQTAPHLAAAIAPLFSNLAGDLTLRRDGSVVHWSYEGQTVIVAQQPDGTATASFVAAPGIDAVNGDAVSAVYRRTAERRYRLNANSCRALVGDMIAFFAGEREPFFTFTGARSLEA
jgi:hypothetical protein